MNALTTQELVKSCPPAVITREFDRLVGRLSNAIETTPGGALEVSERFAPSPAEKQAVQTRMAQLDEALFRADPANDPGIAKSEQLRVQTMLAALLGGMSTMGASGDAAKLKISLCASALRSFPVWVVERACSLVSSGRTDAVLGSKDIGLRKGYPPEAPQLADLCRHIVAPVHAERSDLTRLLQAKVYREPTEADIARRDEVVAEALAKIKRANDMRAPEWERQAKERTHRASETADAGFIPSMSLSEDLAASIAAKQERGPVDDEAKTPS